MPATPASARKVETDARKVKNNARKVESYRSYENNLEIVNKWAGHPVMQHPRQTRIINYSYFHWTITSMERGIYVPSVWQSVH